MTPSSHDHINLFLIIFKCLYNLKYTLYHSEWNAFKKTKKCYLDFKSVKKPAGNNFKHKHKIVLLTSVFNTHTSWTFYKISISILVENRILVLVYDSNASIYWSRTPWHLLNFSKLTQHTKTYWRDKNTCI